MKFLEILSLLIASVLPGGDSELPLTPGVTVVLPQGTTLVAEEQVEIRIGDEFAAAVLDPVSGEIFSQSEWIEITK